MGQTVERAADFFRGEELSFFYDAHLAHHPSTDSTKLAWADSHQNSDATDSGGQAFPRRLEDYVDHNVRVGVHRSVVYAMGMYLRAHAFGHEMLRLRINHAVFFGYQIPRRLRLPQRLWGRVLNTLNGDGPLHSGGNTGLVRGRFMGERPAKCIFRHPDKVM